MDSIKILSNKKKWENITHILNRIYLLAEECQDDKYAKDWKSVQYILTDLKKDIDTLKKELK